jgi:AAA+ superfamily predicted ATPase
MSKLKIQGQLYDAKQAGTPLIWAHTVEPTRFFDTEKNFFLRFNATHTPAIYRFSATATLDEHRPGDLRAPYRSQYDDITRNIGPDGVVHWFVRAAPANSATHDASVVPSPDTPIIEDPPQHCAPEGSILFLLDADAELQHLGGSRHSNARLTRLLEESVPKLINQFKTIVILSHTLDVPEELEHEAVLVEHGLPEEDKLEWLVKQNFKLFEQSEEVEHNGKIQTKLTETALEMMPDQISELVNQLKGLTIREADTCLSRAVTENKSKRKRNPSHPKEFDLAIIRAERVKAVRKNSSLEIIEPKGGLELVGGMEEFKNWVRDNEPFFSGKFKEEGIPSPKGVVLFGVGGTGKTHVVGCLGAHLKRTVLRWDVGASKGGIVGQTEANVRRVLRDAKAQAPAILFVDEAGKLFPNARGGVGATLDGGVSSGIYASLLTFQQENDGGVFLVMACNDDIQNFPAPALRRGRIDSVFYIGLPEPAERTQVAQIHLRKRGWDAPEILSLAENKEFLQITNRFTASEIEEIVVESIKLKIRDKGPRPAPVELGHLLAASRAIVPMSRTNGDEIEAIERFARDKGYLRDRPSSQAPAANSPARPGKRSAVSLADMEAAA